MNRGFSIILLILWAGGVASAAPREAVIPLHNGILQIHDLNRVLCRELGLPSCPDRNEIDLRNANGQEFLFAVNSCLWNGVSLQAKGEACVIVQFESPIKADKCEALRRLTRVYFAEKQPHATAAQARNWGLAFPQPIKPGQPLVVLIHGLDSDRSECLPMAQLLQQAGHQIAYFSYPGDQPIADSAALLARCLKILHDSYPAIPIDLVTHSMGGLVARQYIEGPEYAGGVKHLIMVAPPNGGSQWARMRILLSMQENDRLRHDDPDWHWSWLITEGMGEAGHDLLPGSEFLKQLNHGPRRTGVRYTIVAGNRSSVQRVEATCAQSISAWLPARARNWWGLRYCYAGLRHAADHFHNEAADSDGPVALANTKLAGVSDYVVLPADHLSLFLLIDGQPPAAWPIVKDRLSH